MLLKVALDGFYVFQVKKKPETSYKFDFHTPVFVKFITTLISSFKNLSPKS